MRAAFQHSAADRALASIAGCLTPEVARRLADARLDDATQARIEDLADRNSEGSLTGPELDEYQTFVSVIDVISLLQAKARGLAGGGGAGG